MEGWPSPPPPLLPSLYVTRLRHARTHTAPHGREEGKGPTYLLFPVFFGVGGFELYCSGQAPPSDGGCFLTFRDRTTNFFF